MNGLGKWMFACGMAAALLAASVEVSAAGAIAGGSNGRFGVSYDFPNTGAAQQKALNECGRACKVLLVYESGCGAHAVDRTSGSTIYGLGKGKNKAAAQNNAMNFCQQHGGQKCAIRAWSCNSR